MKTAKDYCKKWYDNNKSKESLRKKMWREANPELASSRATKWALANPDKVKDARLKRKYGIGIDQYNQLYEEQNGLCAICGKPETSSSRNGKIKELSVDHNHRTSAVRGLLCMACNQSLGGFKDNPEYLDNAARYLRKYDRH